MNIDPNTGLPELPDGEFWRIEENRTRISRPGTAGQWERCDHRKPDIDHHIFDRESRTEMVFGRLQCRAKQRPVDLHRKNWGGWTYGYGMELCTDPDPVTPENVVERCMETLAERNENDRRQAIYGTYPPKKLEVTS